MGELGGDLVGQVEFLVEEGMISREDASLFTVVDRAEDAVAALQAFYRGVAPA